MESATACRPSLSLTLPTIRSAHANGPDALRFRSTSRAVLPALKLHPLISHGMLGQGKVTLKSKRWSRIRASASSSDSESPANPIAPLQLESPIGQFLTQILVSHPHLVPAAVDQQLEQLQTDRDAEAQSINEEAPASAGTDLILYRRIAEVKDNERRKALEEILYALVVQKFMDADVPLIPSIAPSSDPSGRVDTWPSHDEKLKKLHSPEAYEMVENHLALILGHRTANSSSIAEISKLRVGQVYAASVMYGYFLKRVDQRFQLEKTMKTLREGSDDNGSSMQNTMGPTDATSSESANTASRITSSHPEVSGWSGGDGVSQGGFGYGIKASRLRTYVMSFDGETLQRYATIRARESVSMIEKHTEALFGRPEIVITPQGTMDSSKDEQIKISFGGLKKLVLEAVTFGSFLWDVESYVDSRYHFVAN